MCQDRKRGARCVATLPSLSLYKAAVSSVHSHITLTSSLVLQITTNGVMTTKPLILLAALTLCCCFASLQARPRQSCMCLRTLSNPIPVRIIKDIKVVPISGHCRRVEMIVTRRNGSQVCVDPAAKWINDLLRNLQNKQQTSSSTTVTPTGSTLNF
ncbi:interleukin-8 [Centropristis striata]|uniref:interleukin-8 n=1 Tax=Centropristis striata TaxID=184440 RepID=UPI0027E00370|nr:interleukin-8 [Centropristis striata]